MYKGPTRLICFLLLVSMIAILACNTTPREERERAKQATNMPAQNESAVEVSYELPSGLDSTVEIGPTELEGPELPDFLSLVSNPDATSLEIIRQEEFNEETLWSVSLSFTEDQEVRGLLQTLDANIEDLGYPLGGGEVKLSNDSSIAAIQYSEGVSLLEFSVEGGESTPALAMLEFDYEDDSAESVFLYIVTTQGYLELSSDGIYFSEFDQATSGKPRGLAALKSDCINGPWYDLKKCMSETAGKWHYVAATCATALYALRTAWVAGKGVAIAIIAATVACGWPFVCCVPFVGDDPPIVGPPSIKNKLEGQFYYYCPAGIEAPYRLILPLGRVSIEVDDDRLPKPQSIYEKVPAGFKKIYKFKDCGGNWSPDVRVELPKAQPKAVGCPEKHICREDIPGQAICSPKVQPPAVVQEPPPHPQTFLKKWLRSIEVLSTALCLETCVITVNISRTKCP